jgi:hypothetical protein
VETWVTTAHCVRTQRSGPPAGHHAVQSTHSGDRQPVGLTTEADAACSEVPLRLDDLLDDVLTLVIGATVRKRRRLYATHPFRAAASLSAACSANTRRYVSGEASLSLSCCPASNFTHTQAPPTAVPRAPLGHCHLTRLSSRHDYSASGVTVVPGTATDGPEHNEDHSDLSSYDGDLPELLLLSTMKPGPSLQMTTTSLMAPARFAYACSWASHGACRP